MSNSGEDEPVTFKVVMTSDAAIKEVPLTTSTTKLMELKQILANEEYFGSKAPVRRQRLFHLGRELKSGGRSLCNLGLGKFNNRILHLYIRPCADGNDKGENTVGDGACSRKRSLAAASQSTQEFSRQRLTNDLTEQSNVTQQGSSIFSQQPVVASTNSHSTSANNNNIAIDLVDSSDDDEEVEIIEVL